MRRVLESPNGWLNRTEADFVELSIAKKRRVFVRTISAVSIAFVALSIITMIALHEWGRALEGEATAIKKGRIAESRHLAVLSDAVRPERLDLAMLLALEAAKQEDTLEARGSLQRALDARPELVRFLHVPEGEVWSVAFGPEGKIAAGDGGVGLGRGVVLFDARGERLRPAPLEVNEGHVTSVAFGPEGKIAAGYGGGGVVLFDARGERLGPRRWRSRALSIAWPSGRRAGSPRDIAAAAASAAWCSSTPVASGSDRAAEGRGRCLERCLRAGGQDRRRI